jgi:hypothetical protein
MSSPTTLAKGRRRDDALPARKINTNLPDCVVSVTVVLVISAPMILTKSGFANDFTNHLWLVAVAGHVLAQAGHPSYFFNATGAGVFYPWYAFYGGTLYMFTGGLGDLLGDNPAVAYVGVTILAIAGIYGGTLWLGRQLGLGRWISHAPALAVVTSAYFVSLLYGRGSWPEFMAICAIAPMLAGALHLVRVTPWRPWPILVFVASTIVFTGSHNITLLWGTAIGVVGGIVLWIAVGMPRSQLGRRIVMVAILGLVGMLINAWYLLPAVSYAGDVKAHIETELGPSVDGSRISTGILIYDSPGVLLDPLRSLPASSPTIFVQVPDWFLAWGLVAGATLLWRAGANRRLKRVWLGVIALIVALLSMIISTSFWYTVPYPFDELQFPFRLGAYVSYGAGALVLVAGLALQRSAGGEGGRWMKRWLRASLVLVCAISGGLCVWQLWAPNTLSPKPAPSYERREEALTNLYTLPKSWYDPASYNDYEAPVIQTAPNRTLYFSPRSIHGDRFAGWVDPPAGIAPIQTNIAGGDYLVHISGLTLLGRSEAGYAVVRRERRGGGPVHVVLETTHSATITLARALSALACVIVCAVLAWSGMTTYRARRLSSLGSERS